jgi:hypothetical protein
MKSPAPPILISLSDKHDTRITRNNKQHVQQVEDQHSPEVQVNRLNIVLQKGYSIVHINDQDKILQHHNDQKAMKEKTHRPQFPSNNWNKYKRKLNLQSINSNHEEEMALPGVKLMH